MMHMLTRGQTKYENWAEIARLEKITLQDLLYSVKNKSRGSETHNHRDRNEEFSYGIGQDWREKLQLKGDLIKIRNKSDDNRYGFLAYFEHYERATPFREAIAVVQFDA